MIDITENVRRLEQQIREFEARYHRAPGSVTLLAVSKRHSEAGIRLAHAVGLQDFGENYLQEAELKIAALADLPLRWHFIGPIQSNKTGGIANAFDWVHSVDRRKIAQRLNDQRRGKPLNVCVQVNLSDETNKSGVALSGVAALCEFVEEMPNLALRGLMAIPAPASEFAAQRACFHRLAESFNALRSRFRGMDTLSMGMSGDFEAAIAEGSTLIRLGTAIFGPRES